jgi:hypothetical protein
MVFKALPTPYRYSTGGSNFFQKRPDKRCFANAWFPGHKDDLALTV